jgi:hypothetical protein
VWDLQEDYLKRMAEYPGTHSDTMETLAVWCRPNCPLGPLFVREARGVSNRGWSADGADFGSRRYVRRVPSRSVTALLVIFPGHVSCCWCRSCDSMHRGIGDAYRAKADQTCLVRMPSGSGLRAVRSHPARRGSRMGGVALADETEHACLYPGGYCPPRGDRRAEKRSASIRATIGPAG